MSKMGLNYDPEKFFCRVHVPILLEKGILKYYDSKTLVPAWMDNKVLDGLKISRPIKTENGVEETGGNKKKNESMKDCPQNNTLPMQDSVKIPSTSNNTTAKPSAEKKEKLSPGAKPRESSSDGAKRKSRVPKRESFSPDAKSRVASPETESRISKVAKSERLSPAPKSRVASPEAGGRKSRAAKMEILSPDTIHEPPTRRSRGLRSARHSPDSASQEASSEAPSTNSLEENNSAPLKKPRGRPGRPRKSTVSPALNVAPPDGSESTEEERVRIQSKPPKRSHYFSSNVSIIEKANGLTSLRRERKISDAPPRSPYNLIQEDLFHDPWQLLIATIFLNSTSGRLAIPLALEFLKRWPTPQLARQAKVDDILDIIEPLGFGRTRAAVILRFSHEYLTKDWKLPIELYGIGEYGNDSYKIFCLKNAWKKVESDDPMLMMYLNWRRATEHLRKKFGTSAGDTTSIDPDDMLSDSSGTATSKTLSKNIRANLSPEETNQLPRKRLRTRTK